MWWMGFYGSCKPGPGWLTQGCDYPNNLSVLDDFRQLRDDYRFETLLSAHGSPCFYDAHYHFNQHVRALLQKHQIDDDFEYEIED